MQSIVIKAYYENGQGGEGPEIRRFSGGENPTYAFVHDKVKEVFTGLATGLFNIHWKDSDGDLVLCSSEDEMKEALTSVKDNVLKLYISDMDPGSSENPEVIPGCEGWRRKWGRGRGICGGHGMKKGWRWRCAGGMPMEGVPPHGFRRWMKRYMKHCHKKGNCGSWMEGEVTPCDEFDNQPGYKCQRETGVKEKGADENVPETSMEDGGTKDPPCHQPDSSDDTSSDDDKQPEVQYPGFSGIFSAGLPGFMGMMGPGIHPSHPPHPPHPIGVDRWWPTGGFHGFRQRPGGWPGRDWEEFCHGARGRHHGHHHGHRHGHHHGKKHGECQYKRHQFQKEADKEHTADGDRPKKGEVEAEDDVIVMEA